MDVFDRLRATLNNPFLRRNAITTIVAISVGLFCLELVTDTFNPNLVDDRGEYVGNPIQLTIGCIGLLLSVFVGFYAIYKWHQGATSDRGADALEAARQSATIPTGASNETATAMPSTIIEKLNLPERDAYFYTSAFRHHIDKQLSIIRAGEATHLSWQCISTIAALKTTHAFTQHLLSIQERELIIQACALEKDREALTATSPAFLDFIDRLHTT